MLGCQDAFPIPQALHKHATIVHVERRIIVPLLAMAVQLIVQVIPFIVLNSSQISDNPEPISCIISPLPIVLPINCCPSELPFAMSNAILMLADVQVAFCDVVVLAFSVGQIVLPLAFIPIPIFRPLDAKSFPLVTDILAQISIHRLPLKKRSQ